MINNILKGLRRHMLLMIISTAYMFLLSGWPTNKHTCIRTGNSRERTAVIKITTTGILLAQTQSPLFEITIFDWTF